MSGPRPQRREKPSEDAAPRAGHGRFEELALREFDFVWRNLRRLGVAEDAVADVSQQVWIVVARKIATIAPDRERSFLFGTVVRTAATWRRSAARRGRVFDASEGAEEAAGTVADSAPTADHLLDQRRARSLLDDAILSLTDDVRDVFVLFECEELSSVEIASLLELPVGTVSSRLRRGREQFGAYAARLRAQMNFPNGGRS